MRPRQLDRRWRDRKQLNVKQLIAHHLALGERAGTGVSKGGKGGSGVLGCGSTLTTIIPSRSARLHHTCRVSVATAFCLSFFRANTVRMLCKRSASLMTSTSGSETMFTMKVRSCSSSSLPSPMPRLWPDYRAAKMNSRAM